MKEKCIFIIIDALRYDVLANEKSCKYLFPNISKIIQKGFIKKVIANAQSTQFVLPSIFSLTYPLDYGGYNTGIRNRPFSYVECFKRENFKTFLMASCNQMGVGTGYERGFDNVLTTSDFRVLLEQKIHRTLLYEVQLYKKGEQNKKDMLEIIKKEFGIVLTSLEEMIKAQDQSLWPKKLRRINNQVAENCIKEKEILINNPEIIAEKIWHIPGGIYWYLLGKKAPYSLSYYFMRLKSAFSWRFKNLIKKQTLWPFLTLNYYPVIFGEIIDSICKKITEIKDDKWMLHLHIMDVHDCRSINKPLHIIYRFKYFPKWIIARFKNKSNRRFIYDSAVMYVDEKIGILLAHLERENIIDETTILITADHGAQYAESPRKKFGLGFRTYYEDIDIPIVMLNAGKFPKENGLHDSMSITASFLDSMNIPGHKSFKGTSIFQGSKEVVISENCGHGNADLKRRDIYFTVTTSNFKMMTVLENNSLKTSKLYDIRKDPKELKNLANNTKYQKIIDKMNNLLIKERKEIFILREVNLDG